ncbi:MAG TPA: Ig-like domain-containing protein [Kofleriaceae bacterium]|nr:Ig-like domain-containing protein [Kofleriaceae bacterium]
MAAFGIALLSFLVAGCSSGGPGMSDPCTLPPASELTAVETYPVNEANGVAVGATLRVRFNTCVDESTLTAQSVLLAKFGTLVPGSIGYEAPTATVLFDPAADLEYASAYALSVGLFRGAHGEKQNQAVGVFFETQSAPEFVPPVTTATPPGSRYNTPQSVVLSCVDNPGGTGCAGTFYTLDASTPSPASTRYTNPISITTDTTLRFFSVDGQGNVEAAKQEQYIIDTVPPTMTGSVPANGTTGVPLTQTITVTFSEDMAPATLNASTVSINHGVTATLRYDPSTYTLTVQPTERLACGTTYQVAVSAGAIDIATNPLTQPATFRFTTITDCDEPITTASVASGVYLTAQSVTLTCSDVGTGCARIRYTTDGTVPSEANGTTVSAATAGPISIGAGDTRLLFFSEDNAGNREVLRERAYTVSVGSGFTFVGTDDGLARGVGPTPPRFVSLRPPGTSAVFFRDSTNNRLYKGTARGLFVSDGGEAWTELTSGLGGIVSVFARGCKVLVGTGGGGLYVSIDGGATFTARDVGASLAWVYDVLAVDEKVFAATDHGLAVSVNKGVTFTLRTTAQGLGSNTVRDLVLDNGLLYAATAIGLSISNDDGVTFTNHTTGLASTSVNAIAVSGTTVYAATDSGLSISNGGGQSFSVTRTTANGLGSNFVNRVVVSGSNVYVGTGEPFISGATNSFAVSTNGGTSFTPHTVSAAHTDLRVDALQVDGTTVRVGAYPGYYLSTDGGLTFTAKDLRGAVKRLTGASGVLYATIEDASGQYGGIAISSDYGMSFTIRDAGDGLPRNEAEDIAVDGNIVYVATFSGLGISTNGGTSFTTKIVNATQGPPTDRVWAGGATVWAATTNSLELSTNSASSFAQRILNTGVNRGITVSGSNVYLASGSGLWVSNSGGSSGSFSLKGAVQGLGNTNLSDVAVDGSGVVLASSSTSGTNGLYVSTDNGGSFTAMSTQLFPRGVYAQGSTWYAATFSGLYVSTDAGGSWRLRGSASGVQSAANDVFYMP